MLKYLSKVRIEFNGKDPRAAACLELLKQCYKRRVRESNPACVVAVKRRTDDHHPQIGLTFVDGAEEVFDAASTSVQAICTNILEKGVSLDAEKMFREAGLSWPVVIPPEELRMPAPTTTPRKIELKK